MESHSFVFDGPMAFGLPSTDDESTSQETHVLRAPLRTRHASFVNVKSRPRMHLRAHTASSIAEKSGKGLPNVPALAGEPRVANVLSPGDEPEERDDSGEGDVVIFSDEDEEDEEDMDVESAESRLQVRFDDATAESAGLPTYDEALDTPREPPRYTCDIHYEDHVDVKYETPGLKNNRWHRAYLVIHGTSLKVFKDDWLGCHTTDPSDMYHGVEEQVSSSLGLLLNMQREQDDIRAASLLPGNAPGGVLPIDEPCSRPEVFMPTPLSRALEYEYESLTPPPGGPASQACKRQAAAPPLDTKEPITCDSARNCRGTIKLPYFFSPREGGSQPKPLASSASSAAAYDEDKTSTSPSSSLKGRAAKMFKIHRTSTSKPQTSNLSHHFSTQYMEFHGIAFYRNRDFVVRVHSGDGQQFLINFKDRRSARRGLESLRSSIDVSLDLAERTMPRHHTLPRSGRTRRRA